MFHFRQVFPGMRMFFGEAFQKIGVEFFHMLLLWDGKFKLNLGSAGTAVFCYTRKSRIKNGVSVSLQTNFYCTFSRLYIESVI